MDDDIPITLHSTSFIPPASPTHPSRLPLSSLDLVWEDLHYPRSLFFFRTLPDQYPSIVHSLKSSLALALVQFYPFAGRLVREDGRLNVDCNDAGVEFVEATVDVAMKELEDDHFQMRPFFRNLARLDELDKSKKLDLPLLSVQVTSFLGGGIVIGTAESHVVADGFSFWHFFSSWAECARGLPISVPPVHMRTALSQISDNGDATHESTSKDPVLRNENSMRPEDPAPISEKPSRELGQRVFHFSGEKIKKLKAMAAEEGKASFTSFEAFCAHLWKALTRAREHEETQLVAFVVFVNIRPRMNPALPTGYFGNGAMGVFVMATAGELTGESVGATAARIHEKIVGFDDGAVRRGLEMLNKAQSADVEEMKGGLAEIVTTFASFSHRLPVFETDFGFGSPICARNARVVNDGELSLVPGGPLQEGSVDVCVALPANVIAKLQSNPLFLSF